MRHMLLIHGSHDKDWGPRHLRRPGGTHPVLALVSPYCQHINTRRTPGQGCGKLMLNTCSPTPLVETILFDLTVEQLPMDAKLVCYGSTVARRLSSVCKLTGNCL